jgi:DNA-binding response OmpR family regulator
MVIDDDREWSTYYQNLLHDFNVEFFQDGVAATARMGEQPPRLIILDILLTGPTGFSILNEMQSYADLAKIPVIIISSVELKLSDLAKYGVIKVFDKSTMLPADLLNAIREVIS